MSEQSERPYATGADFEDDLDRDEREARRVRRLNALVGIFLIVLAAGIWIYTSMPTR
jgi:hypothetical protein